LSRHDVTTCLSATEALARLRGDETFDAILCDLMMPGFTGMELHAELAALRPDLAGRMLFMTGGAFTADAQAFLEDPRIRYIEKPFLAAEVRRQISELLAASALEGAA
jgi:CheY-like chemotaxis protein